jgi:hypothetical protein
MDGGDDTKGTFLSAYCCIPLQSLMATVNHGKALVPAKRYHVVITANISVTIAGEFREIWRRGKRTSLRSLFPWTPHRTFIFYEY